MNMKIDIKTNNVSLNIYDFKIIQKNVKTLKKYLDNSPKEERKIYISLKYDNINKYTCSITFGLNEFHIIKSDYLLKNCINYCFEKLNIFCFWKYCN